MKQQHIHQELYWDALSPKMFIRETYPGKSYLHVDLGDIPSAIDFVRSGIRSELNKKLNEASNSNI